MSQSARNRFRAIVSAIAFLFLSTTAVGSRGAVAAGTFGRSFEYGVFVAGKQVGKRLQVTHTPIEVPAGDAFRIQGWVLDPRTMKPGKSLLVASDYGKAKIVPSYPLRRPDVATALKNPDAEMSGFQLTVPGGLATGFHRFHFAVVGKDGTVVGLGTDVLVTISH